MNTKHIEGIGTPTAIIIVGVLIAAAIFFKGDGSATNPSTGNQQVAVNKKSVETLLDELNVDKKDFNKCLTSDAAAEIVQSDMAEGITGGVTGTPYSLVVDTQTDKKVALVGGQSPETVKLLIDAMLQNSPEIDQASIESSISTDTSNDYIRGAQDGRILIIEFSDIECPFCGAFHKTMQQLIAEYPEDLQWAYRHFPLDQIHPNARKAGIAVECIGQQQGADAYWEALDAMFLDRSLPASL